MKTINQLLNDLREATLDCFWVPNTVTLDGETINVLPQRYQDDREGGRTLRRCEEFYTDNVAPKLSQHEIDKAEKARRADVYRTQLESGIEIEYQEDEDRLYRNQVAFVGGMVSCGMLDEDLDEAE